MAVIDDLAAALKTEFSTGMVEFRASIPSTVSAPSVTVVPGDPFLEPREAAGPLVRERWDVVVAVSLKDAQTGIRQMRELSLRVRKVVNANGAVWQRASGPRRLAGPDGVQQSQIVVSVNEVQIRLDANSITE